MYTLIGLISLSGLLLAVSGQLSNLSPSYSVQGFATRNESGSLARNGPYNVSVDITRKLQYVNENITNTTGFFARNLKMSSVYDNTSILSINGVCNSGPLSPNEIFLLDMNIWELFANGTESPPGTYTFTLDDIRHQVVLVNGIPVSFTIFFDNPVPTVFLVTVNYFNNTPPAFSTFTLPSECSQFTCTACYSSAVSVSISITLILTTLLMYLFTTL